ncbi:response regulator [Marinibactrum halimedae]|uniref:histidine kinase n=1 Tax=Marinibactrum halimedae TaxID=1444977 RepID=A0AA37WN69_9GAMM|nr:response regulator [Marinibactrum halimedae]MCD9459187.1 response regulator [Marinibactrum halimedae]GLS27258.1 histidine kinase [Marinibactrum halimedae]
MHFQILQSLIRKMALLPFSLTIAILALLLTAIYYREMNIITRSQTQNTASGIAHLASNYLYQRDYDATQKILNAYMQKNHVRSVRVLDANEQIFTHIGPRYSKKSPKANWFSNQAQVSGTTIENQYRMSYPIVSDVNGEVIGWVDIVVDQTPMRLIYFEFVLAIFCLCFAVPVISAIALQLWLKRFKPAIKEIEESLRAVGAGNYKYRIRLDSNSELKPLADDVNWMARSIEQAQVELQSNVEQSMNDLRETMETIEIQNIELDLARKKALEASRIKSEFLANTSHEIRTPLNGIIGFSQLLLKSDVNEQQTEYLRTIETSSQGLLTIINDILDFSQIESGQVHLDYAPMNLRTVLEETVQILAPEAIKKQLEVITLTAPDIPMQLVGDPLRLKQILTNLLSNAIKYSEKGNVILRVKKDESITTLKNENQKSNPLLFSVEDSGIGIDTDKNQLFEAFSKVDNKDNRRVGGTGLGLAISKGLVTAMGGNIGVHSVPGEGSTFWFSLKLDSGAKPKDNQYAALMGISIMVCSANALLREQLQQTLSLWKVHVELIDSPDNILKTAGKLTNENKPQQLLLLDVNEFESIAEEANFIDQLSYQLNLDFHCKTVLLTTPYRQRDLQLEHINKSVAYANKPAVQDRLYRTICTHLNLNKQIKEAKNTKSITVEGRPPKILAVDDNPANLMLVKEFLINLGAETHTATNGEEAIKICQTDAFDLIFMDIQMPGIDGMEATKTIRQQTPSNQPRTPIVALTAHAVNEKKSQLLLAGMDDYLSKPITEDQLIHIIQRWCNATTSNAFAKSPMTEKVMNIHTLHPKKEAQQTPQPAAAQHQTGNAVKVTSAPAEKVVDIGLCLQLSNQKSRLAHDMLAMLVDNLPKDLEKIRQYYETKTFSELEHTVHKLHGGASYTGVPKLKEAASALDKLLQNKHYDNLDSPINALTESIEELLVWSSEMDLAVLFEE